MFPIGDTNVRGGYPAVVNWLFIGINVLVWIFEAGMSNQAVQQFINTYGVIPAEIMAGNNLLSLFTSMFLHGGWAHIIGNMLFLWVFGDNIEAVLGHIGFTVFYLAGGLAASVAHIFFNLGSQIPSVGASGAIAAILGAYVVMFPRSQVRLLIGYGYITRVSAIVFLGVWFISQLFNGVAAIGQTAQTSGVAFWAHIGGFVFGLVMGFVLKGRAAGLATRR
jgi:membrane associated rhomboid family serine protease